MYLASLGILTMLMLGLVLIQSIQDGWYRE